MPDIFPESPFVAPSQKFSVENLDFSCMGILRQIFEVIEAAIIESLQNAVYRFQYPGSPLALLVPRAGT